MKYAGLPFISLPCLSVGEMKSRINPFGFTEISDLLRFLELVCKQHPDYADYSYIRKKIDLCLSCHDNESDYFIPLREFASELDCIISMAK